jgi:hypothetical protein
MVKVIVWALCLYAGIKFGHLIASAGLGFGRSETSWSKRLRGGEPWLMIGTLVLALLVGSYVSWWTHRFAEGQYTYASDCYGRMAAAHLLPGRPARFDRYDAARAAAGHVRFAEIHGAQLGIPAAAVDKKLDEGRLAYSRHFARLASENARSGIAASFRSLDRCLNGDGSPRGEILNPV